MILRHRVNPSWIMRIGFLSLILANLSNYFLHRASVLTPDLTDATTGFLFGIAIACLLLSVVLKRNRLDGK